MAGFCFVNSHRGLLSYSRVSRLGLRHRCLLCPLLTSGDSSRRLSTPVAQGQTARPPRVLRTHLHAYLCRIYAAVFRASIGLCIYWPAHPTASPLSAGCSSEQRFACGFLRIPPRDGHPCRSANTSPCRVCRGLSPPSEGALPGAPTRIGGSESRLNLNSLVQSTTFFSTQSERKPAELNGSRPSS